MLAGILDRGSAARERLEETPRQVGATLEDMRIETDPHTENEMALHDPFRAALVAQSRMWPEVRTQSGGLDLGWMTAEALFASDDAIEEYLAYESSFHSGTDRKSSAAFLMTDYGYIFSMATVPLFVGFGIVPDLSLSRFALQFYTGPLEHDGRTIQVRRAHVCYLSHAYFTNRKCDAAHPDTRGLLDGDGLCDLFRRSVEDHFCPLVELLHRKTGLPCNALWRLVADAIAGRFLDVGRRFDCLEHAKVSAMTILKQPGSPLNNRQLHYFDLTLRDDEQRELRSWTFRARGGCCRYYTVEGGEFCETCVLQKPKDRNAQLLAIMRHRFGMLAGDEA